MLKWTKHNKIPLKINNFCHVMLASKSGNLSCSRVTLPPFANMSIILYIPKPHSTLSLTPPYFYWIYVYDIQVFNDSASFGYSVNVQSAFPYDVYSRYPWTGVYAPYAFGQYTYIRIFYEHRVPDRNIASEIKKLSERTLCFFLCNVAAMCTVYDWWWLAIGWVLGQIK